MARHGDRLSLFLLVSGKGELAVPTEVGHRGYYALVSVRHKRGVAVDRATCR